MRVVTYVTPRYRPVVDRLLRPSLARQCVPFTCIELGSEFGSWEAAARHKATVLRTLYDVDAPSGGLLWLDADCVVHTDPRPLLEAMDCDLAVHYLGGRELLSGTLYLAGGRTRVADLLSDWEHRCSRAAGCDQLPLQRAVETAEERGLRVERLGPEWAYIFDTSRRLYPGVTPIVEHFQASRDYRGRAAQ